MVKNKTKIKQFEKISRKVLQNENKKAIMKTVKILQ